MVCTLVTTRIVAQQYIKRRGSSLDTAMSLIMKMVVRLAGKDLYAFGARWSVISSCMAFENGECKYVVKLNCASYKK